MPNSRINSANHMISHARKTIPTKHLSFISHHHQKAIITHAQHCSTIKAPGKIAESRSPIPITGGRNRPRESSHPLSLARYIALRIVRVRTRSRPFSCARRTDLQRTCCSQGQLTDCHTIYLFSLARLQCVCPLIANSITGPSAYNEDVLYARAR